VKLYSKITPEVEKRIDELFSNKPDSGFDFKYFKPRPSTREF